jgi:hypothetical protein
VGHGRARLRAVLPHLGRGVTAMSPIALSNRLPALAREIARALADVRHHHAATVVSAIEAGAALAEAKALLPHGGWLPWLREHCGLSERTARDYMRLAEHKDKIGSAADLSIRAALAALVPARTCGDFIMNALGKLDDAEETMRGVARAIEDEPDADKVRAIVTLTEMWSSAGYGLAAAVTELRKAFERADGVTELQYIVDLAGRSVASTAEFRMYAERFLGVLLATEKGEPA